MNECNSSAPLALCHFLGKISPWPRPGFSLRGIVQLLSRQGGPGSYMTPVIILVSRQGGHFVRNDNVG